MTRGHVDKPRCPFCYENFDDIPSVRKHCAIQHRENCAVENKDSKMFKCNQCDFITQNQTLFREHMTRGHVNKPRCPFCYKPFDD